MKAVCQFDQDDTDVLRHGKEHFSQILCLHFHFISRIGKLSQLGNAVHKKGHL